ncbi:sugar ABC transporter ATP-binding protein [Vallitalea pronyensis]|uniref:Sugar ABC transporter ATP-binding protein n=1 Tax=Vallitalea pronyensis TaxID=1348613 RepID=A0A8J8ML20_9FIRM|nr:sugar ABC transporter ATP-binding protein [Vallitalea pronyensis]QUI23484.1 sugar ABC transporter ATP-binding protein [Vallitalea pronyensis]
MNNTLEFRDICKNFPGVKALDNMSFKVQSGEVVAFLGENGAGKSTLLKILNGDFQQCEGSYLIDNEAIQFKNPYEAIQAGISIIYQERQVVDYLTVGENVFMGNMPLKANGLVDFKTMNEATQKIIDEFDLDMKATDQVKHLSVAYQQMVEIMKAYNRQLKVIAFDEPTASLSNAEIEKLFLIIRNLKKKGVIVLYVSHRLKEIFELSDRVIVFKDGRLVDIKNTKETNEAELVKLMVGRDLGDVFNELDRNETFGDNILDVKNLSNHYVKDISFHVRKGEILGLSGLVGAGRTETIRSIFGADPLLSGDIYFDGEKVQIKSPEDAIALGMGLCPEDRKGQGIAPIRSVKENASMAILKRLTKFGFIQKKAEKEVVQKGIVDLNIKTSSMEKQIVYLSGGNQQKVILARWLAHHPKLLILDEPTKGIDVGAKSEIYRIICRLANQGIGIIIISSELPEIIGISDRIMVMANGEKKGELNRQEATEERILGLAMLGTDIGGSEK